ncbi:MAG: DUF4838 domain-containing protein [Gemmataceae bacterium]|nr:DUF4838 domain-containing protein [Gemmataceae bacterium]
MQLIWRSGCTLLVLALLPISAPAAETPLARGGKALLPVVVSGQAAESTRKVAAELADYLSRISGARFEVKTGDGSTGIVLGTLAEFPRPDLAKALEIRDRFDGKEVFAIRSEGKRLLLLGATDLGASHAAFRLLEVLGCRWFFPAPEWEVIPHRPDLTADVSETSRPALLSRRIWYGYGFFDRNLPRVRQDYEAWARHNRMAASLKTYTGHAWQSIILANKKTFAEHPEYLALVKGQRQGEQLCVSTPAVRALATRWALDFLRRTPQADMVSMETSDGAGQCECAACRALGSISDRAFGLANEVARAVAKEFPGKMVGMLAYSEHSEPPSFVLEPNVYVQLTAGFIRGRYSFDELKELWPKKARKMGFYEYFSVWLWDFDMPPGGRAANVRAVRERIRDYVKHRATSLDCESGNNWGVHGLGYYVANKLMWDPEADVEALRTDFFDRAFGPAAGAVRRYYDRLDPGNDPLVSEHLLALALRDLDEAGRLAKGRPDVLARLDHLKQYQHYVRLRWDFDRTKDPAKRRELGLEALTHCYRTRYAYMNHWAAMQYSWSGRLAKELGEPTWDGRKATKETPWQQNRPPTAEETERQFRADLERFQPQQVTERKFSADLVPAGLRSAKPADSHQRYQSPSRYALYSEKGEPLEGAITTGLIAWYRDRPAATLTVTDAAGKQIHQQRMILDGKDHPFAVRVPKAGLYWLDLNDSAAGWGIKAPAGRPLTLALSTASRSHSLGQMQRMYFFVPKGTKHIDYFWEGNPHDVLGPDGKVVAKVTERGKFVRVAVPKGTDGQAWSFGRLALGRLWFTNVPNYLAASPDALLVPREAK